MPNFQIEQLKSMPQRPDQTWQGGLFRLYSWITGEQTKPYRPWAALWVAVNEERIAPPSIFGPEEYDLSRALDSLVRFVCEPKFGGYRPGRIEVRDAALADYLREPLGEAGITVERKDSLPYLEEMLVAIAEHQGGHPLPPATLSGKGVTVARMQSFAEAARAFYESAPWQHLTDEDLIRVESPKPPKGMEYATVLGAGGGTFGLAFFGKAEDCWSMHRADAPPDWWADRKEGMWSITFGTIMDMPFDDADLWEEHGWAKAGEDAYPFLTSLMPGMKPPPPDRARLAFVEGLLLALSRSIEEQLDSGRWTVSVETAEGPVEFTLAIPDLLKPPTLQDLIKRGFTPDRRAMEQMHAQMDRFLAGKDFKSMDDVNAAIAREFMGKKLDPSRFPARTDLEKAQDLCFQAFDSIGRRKLQLAREAMKVCPDCADAYVLIAEWTSDINKAVELFTQGTAAGERSLGPERFKKDVGHFWGQTDTRPYMRARFGLARCLDELGRDEEAIEHYRELLRLNPGDNQGVRYLYLPLLLKLGRDAEAARFMKVCQDEPTANWAYTRALLAYRLGGNCGGAHTELKKAQKVNPHVIPYLLSNEEPDEAPGSYRPGSREEALVCAFELRPAFEATPGACEWLQDRAGQFLRTPQAAAVSSARRNRDLRRKQRSKERKRKRR